MAKDSVTVIRVTQKVKIITPKGKYTKAPYQYACPTSVRTRMPVTGQEDIITQPAKWTGADKLTPAEKHDLHMGPNPYIIDPANHILIMHGYEYDNSYDSYIEPNKEGKDVEVDRIYVNPKDHAELTAILAASESPVAKSKVLYNKNKHNFYVDDKEVEAQEKLNNIDLAYDAEQFVRNDIGTGRFNEVLIFLGYAVPEYKVTVGNLSDTRLKALVLDACRRFPQEVLKMKGPGANRIIFAVKVVSHNIIARKKNNDFYYGDIYIGQTFDSVTEWIDDRKNRDIVAKWQTQLDVADRRSKTEKIPD